MLVFLNNTCPFKAFLCNHFSVSFATNSQEGFVWVFAPTTINSWTPAKVICQKHRKERKAKNLFLSFYTFHNCLEDVFCSLRFHQLLKTKLLFVLYHSKKQNIWMNHNVILIMQLKMLLIVNKKFIMFFM